VSVADFIADQQDSHDVPVVVACRALDVSRSWFYQWRGRPQTARGVRRTVLAGRITELFDASGKTYGSPRITLDLRAEGWQVSVNTVARLMAELGLAGRAKPRRRHSLTRQGRRPVARDLVRRQFDAVAPDVLWCGDMTEIATGEGKCYLATVIDMFSRRMLGYAIGERHDAGLVIDALRMAVATRGGDVDGVIFHSDRGSEYTSEQFGLACARMGVVQSMGRVGSALDNAVSESFNSVLKVEYVHRHTFATRTEARLRIATWITGFYNTRRRHSAAGGHPPTVFEQMTAEARTRSQQDQMRTAA
jgi:putative transposase